MAVERVKDNAKAFCKRFGHDTCKEVGLVDSMISAARCVYSPAFQPIQQ